MVIEIRIEIDDDIDTYPHYRIYVNGDLILSSWANAEERLKRIVGELHKKRQELSGNKEV